MKNIQNLVPKKNIILIFVARRPPPLQMVMSSQK